MFGLEDTEDLFCGQSMFVSTIHHPRNIQLNKHLFKGVQQNNSLSV